MVIIDDQDRYKVETRETVRGVKTIVSDHFTGNMQTIEGQLTPEDAIKEFRKRTTE